MTPVLFALPEACCGCRACAAVCPKGAISFIEDRYGFWFPRIDESFCVNCGKCMSVCHFHNDTIDHRKTPIKGFAATMNDKSQIKSSTSGGVFMAVAKWVLMKGGCVFGCVWDDDMNAIHVCAESLDKVLPMQGSKYVQSNVGNKYEEVKRKLQEDRHVLFTGTPCQVAALKSYLGGKEYEKLITLDLICHGVPNNRFFHQFLSALEKQYKGRVTDLHFRHKSPDWLYGRVWVELQRGRRRFHKALLYVESPYSMMFSGKNQCSRLSCSHCKYACAQRVGDMTIGDFWGYQKAQIAFDYRDGLSCVLVNHPKMLPILDELDLTIQEVPMELIVEGNTHLRCPSCKDEKWEYVMEIAANEGYEALAKAYFTENVERIRTARSKRIRMVIKGALRSIIPEKLFK